MDRLIKLHGVRASTVKEDLKRSLDESRSIYWQRLAGITALWSATTRCVKCGKWWMWGVRDNLDFTCDNCN